MPIVTVTEPSDGQTILAADGNNMVNAILAVLNGHVDQDNLADGGITNAKLAGSIDISKLAANVTAGWASISSVLSTVTANGNRSYSLVFNGVDLTPTLSPGMRMQLTRTVAAPTQCTSLNGSTQYYSKTSPAGMTFTTSFVASAWVKLSSYAAGTIVSRYNGTSGWRFSVGATGQIEAYGLNAGSGNYRGFQTYQSIPLNKWVHLAVEIDMVNLTNTPTTMYAMIDGVDVPVTTQQGGTNPTALIQAGNLEVGSYNGGTSPFPGKIAQAAIYSAKVTEATILASMNQTLVGTETSLVSAYSFNNSVNDLNANANNLSANGSALATNADSPYAQGATAGLLEYGIVQAASFATNTTITLQVPEGSAIPTSGGVSAVAYSGLKSPYKFPLDRAKWTVESLLKAAATQSSPAASTWYNVGSHQITAPIGSWLMAYSSDLYITRAAGGNLNLCATLSTGSSSESEPLFRATNTSHNDVLNEATLQQENPVTLAAQTVYYRNGLTNDSSVTSLVSNPLTDYIRLTNGYL